MLTTLQTGYYLGIDGGGTKTHAIVSNESGFVIGQGKSGGSNPHNLPIEQAIENIQQSIREALSQAQQNNNEVNPESVIFEGACLGLAGLDTSHDRQVVTDALNQLPQHEQCLRSKKLVLVNDGLISFKAGTEKNWGISLTAATGSNCYGIDQSGKEAIAGDWGFILGDQGSSYTMGRAILRQVIREHDGRKPKSLLTQVVLDFLDLKDSEDLIHWTYHSGSIPVREIAQLTKIFNDPNVQDSIEISQILNQGASALVEAYTAVARKLKFELDTAEVPVVLNGGLFFMQGRFTERVTRSIKNHSPQANVILPRKSPAEGAIELARMLDQKTDIFPESAITFVRPEEN